MQGLHAPRAHAADNVAPVANPDSYWVSHNLVLTVPSSTGVLANDTDADMDPLTVELVSDVQHGSLTLNADGSFEYTPTTNYVDGDSFTYRAFDGIDYSGVATVSLSIGNTAPTATADSYAPAHNHTFVTTILNGVLANDADVNGFFDRLPLL